MRWSVSFSGTPAEVLAAIAKHSDTLTGQSKVAYDEARPHLVGLVRQNFVKEHEGAEPTLVLSAYGGGSTSNGVEVQRSCSVSLKTHG
jgi:hypothetical protein